MGAVAMEVLSALWFIGIYKVPLLTRPLCSTLMLFGRHLGILNAFVLCLCLVNGVEWAGCVSLSHHPGLIQLPTISSIDRFLST